MVDRNRKNTDFQIYGRLLSYIYPYLFIFFLSICGFAVSAAAQVAYAKWLEEVIEFVNNPVQNYILLLPLSLIVITLIRGIGFFVGNYLMARISNNLVHSLRVDLFNKIPVLPTSFFDDQSSGHLVSRITFNVMQVTGAATNALKVLIREGLLVIFLIAFLMYLNWKLSLFLFIAAPFIALVVGLAARRLRTISSRIQTAMGDVTHVASEAISGQKEVKSFGGKEYEINRFGKASENNKKQNIKLEATNYIASPLIQILVSLALALITWLALDSSVVTTMTAGTFVAFFGAAGMLAKPVKQLSEINSQIQKGLAAAEDIFEQIDSEPEIDEGNFSPGTVEGNINFNNVSFAYKNNPDKRVLNDISLTINKGETIAFVGKSGAGKTSLVNLLPRFYDNFEGTISVDGTSIKDYTLTNLRSQISIVSQDITLFNDSIENNISYGSKRELSDIQAAAKEAFADEFIRLMPDGYNTLVGDDGALLSGGQKQRIAIARAILKNSPILILDEATSALDSESEIKIQEAMSNLTKDRTTLVIAHRLSTIEDADKIVVLDNGKIVEEGSHEELLSLDAHYAKLHANQFKDDTPSKVEEAEISFPLISSAANPIDHTSFIEKSWYRKSMLSWILWPLSKLTSYVSERRYRNYLTSKPEVDELNVPLVVVGNIVAGGTGKTPIVIWLLEKLIEKGYKPSVVSRGFGGQSNRYPLIIDTQTDSSESGDEPKMIFLNTGVPVCVSPDRVKGIKELVTNTDTNIIISDDGLQHYSMPRDVEIAVFDGARGLGNGLCLPAGPLREPKSRLNDVDFILSSNEYLKEDIKSEIFSYEAVDFVRSLDGSSIKVSDWPLSRKINALAGIGNPNKFFDTLRSLGMDPVEHSFPDHYDFMEEDLNFEENLPIVMTEKDAIRSEDLNHLDFWYLRIKVSPPENLLDRILDKIKDK